MKMGKIEFEVVRISERHLDDIAEIERLSFSHPWTREGLMTLVRENGVGFAAIDKESGKVLAYAGMVIAADEGSITDVATHPDYRRRGIARAVMETMLRYCETNAVSYVALEVRESNESAISLYGGLGFEVVGKRPRFYRSPVEDACVMIKHL